MASDGIYNICIVIIIINVYCEAQQCAFNVYLFEKKNLCRSVLYKVQSIFVKSLVKAYQYCIYTYIVLSVDMRKSHL